MAGPKIRLPRSLGLPGLFNRGVGRLHPQEPLKPSTLAKDGFSQPKPDHPWRIFASTTSAPNTSMIMPAGTHTFATGIPGMPDVPLQGSTTDIQARMQLSETQHALYNTWIQNHYVGALVERSYAAILDVASAYRTWASQAETRIRQALDLFEGGTLSLKDMLQIENQLTAEESIYSAIFRNMGHVTNIEGRDDRQVLSSRLRSAIAQLSNAVLGLFLLVRLDTSHSTPPHFKEYRDFLADITDKTEADGYPPGISVPYHSHEIARELLTWLNAGGTREARDGLWTWTSDRRESVTVINQSNALNGRAWPPDPVRDPMLAAQLKFLGWEMRIEDGNRVVLETAPAHPRLPTRMPDGQAAHTVTRLGIVGGAAGRYPTLQHYIQLPMWADAVSTRDFRDVLEDHFHPDHFMSPFIRFRRSAILDRLAVQEAEIDRDFARKTGGPVPVSANTISLFTADAFLARTQARSGAFVDLLELRVEAQLRTLFGHRAQLTDMDLESERNHVLADVLSEGIGAHLPIAKGTIAVSVRDGVIVLRPERSDDYAMIDRMLQDGKISGEALTGGFYCGRNSLGLPFIVINPAMGTHTWSVLRHELQHLRKHASNRTEPYWQMPTPDTVSDYPDALRQHFFVMAKDEVLAYLEEGRPPDETVVTLTRPGGFYDFIAKKRDKLQLNDDDVAKLQQAHFDYIARQVWALHVAVTDMVNYGYHPEAARQELMDRLSDIPFAQWETQLPLAAESAMAVPPRRQAPPPGAHDGQRAELRRFLETQVLPRRKGSLKRLNTIAQRQNQKMEAIEAETRGVVGTQRLQVLRQELQTGNSEMEQLSEVLQRITDEYRGQRQVVQRRRAKSREEVRANGTQFRRLTNTLAHLDMLQDKLAVYLRRSGITELQARIDRMLLIRTAHSQKLIRDSATEAIDGPPLIRVSDGADIRPDDHLKASASASASGKPDGPPMDAAGFKATVATPKGQPAGPTSLPGATPTESEASAPNDPDAAWRGHPGIVSAIGVHYSSAIDNDRAHPDFDLTDSKTSYAIAEGLAKYAQYICIGMRKDQVSLFPVDPFYPAASFLRIMDGLHDHADIPRPARRRGLARTEETWEAHLREAFADDNNLIRDALAYCHFHVRELAQELQIPESRLGARLARYRNALELSTPEVSPERASPEESLRRDVPPLPPSRPTPAAPEVLQQAMTTNREILRTIQDQPRGLGTTTMKLLGRAHHTPGGPNHVPFQVVIDTATGAILPNHYSQLGDLRQQGRDADLVIFRIFAVQRSTELKLLRQQLERRGEWGQEKIPGWLMTRISDATDSDLKFAYTSAVSEAGGGEPALRTLFMDRVKSLEIPAGSSLPKDVRKALRTLEGARFNEKNPTPPRPEGGGDGGGNTGGTDTDRALLQAIRDLPAELRAEALSSGLTTPRVYEALGVEGVLSQGKFQEALRLMLANVDRDHSGAMAQLKRMGYRETEIPALAKAIMDGPIDTLPVIVGSLITRPTAESLRDIAAAMHPDGDFLVFTYRALLRLPRIARATGIDLSDHQIAELAKHYADELIEVATTNSLGAVSPKMALQALLHRQDFLKTIGVDLHTPPAPGAPLRTVPLGDTPYTLALEMGQYEAACGLQIVLYDTSGGKPAPLAIVGFQESGHGIEILRYQGGFLGEAESSNAGRRFRAVSGGVAPLPWLALMTGQVLLTHSRGHGKPLRFLAGERVLFGYPHVGDVPPPHIRSLQDARGPWQTPLLDKWVVEHHRMTAQRDDLLATTTADTRTPFQSQFLEQLDRVLRATTPLIQMYANERAVQKTYDQTAAQLGFERIGPDAPFHDYHKGIVAFGADIRAQSDGLKLDRLLEAATTAMRGDAVFSKWMGRTAPMSFALPDLPPPLEDGAGHGTAVNYSGAPWVGEMLEKAWARAVALLKQQKGDDAAECALDSQDDINAVITQMKIAPSAVDLASFLTSPGLEIRPEKLAPFAERLQALPQDFRLELFTRRLFHPLTLTLFEGSGIFAHHGFEATMRLYHILNTEKPPAAVAQLQRMGYSEAGAQKIISSIAFWSPGEAADIITILLPLSEADALAALNVGKDQYGNFDRGILRQASRILTTATQEKLKLSPDELQYMTNVWAADRMDVVRENSLNAVDNKMALTAMRNRFRMLSTLYGGSQKIPDSQEHDIASVKLGNGIRLTLQYGLYEARCGIQVTLSAPGRFGALILGTFGFQESDTGIEVLRYQGTKHGTVDADETLADFRAFSGGVDPMPWLATVVGTTLLEQARAQGKTLRWIAGERVAMGYPHLMGEGPSHVHSIQDARGPWDSHPQHAAILAEYDALATSSPSDFTTLAAHYRRFQKLEPYAQVFRAGERRTARLYDATAQNLGFRRKGQDTAWHRYTKDPAEFGAGIRNGQGVRGRIFDQSVTAALGAMRADPMFGKWMSQTNVVPQALSSSHTTGPLLMIGLNPRVQDAMTALWKGASRFLLINPDTPYPQVANVIGKNLVDGLIASYGGLARQRLDAVEPRMGKVIERVGKKRLKKILQEAFQYTHNYHTPFVVLENLAFGISNAVFLQMMGLENVIALSHPKSRTPMKTATEWLDDYSASGLSPDLDARRITAWLAAGIDSHRIDAPHFERMRAQYQAEINALPPDLRTGMVVCNLMTDREFTVLHKKGLINKFGLQRIMHILVSAKTGDAQALQGHLAAIGFSPEIAPKLAAHLVLHMSRGINFGHYIESLLSHDVTDVELLFPYFKPAFGDQFEQWRAFDDIAKIRERATRTDIALAPQDATRMAAHNELATMDIVIKNTLGAVDERSAMEASLIRYQLSGELGTHHLMPPFAPLGNPPSYHLALQLGEFEGYNGFQIVLQDKAMRPLGTVGFQESDTHIDVVRYQGRKIRPDVRQDFLKFSGGLDTLQWLGLVAAKFLSHRALATGKTLRWISGDRIHMGYPHRKDQPTEFESIETARNFWKTPHPEIDAEGVLYDTMTQESSTLRQQRHLLMRKEQATPDAKRKAQIDAINARIVALNEKIEPIEQLVTMYRRGPHTQRLYDTAAAALGFVRSDDAPWHTFTGQGQGDALRAKADPNTLDASLKLVDDAMRADPVFSKWVGSSVTPPVATDKGRPSGIGSANLADRGQSADQTQRPPLGIVGGAGEYPALKYPLPEGRAIDAFSPRDTRKIFFHFFGGRTEPGAVAAALRHSRSPAEAFVQLLDQRATTQLKKKLGRKAVLTDMDMEAERNRIMAEVLSTALGGFHIPVAKGRVTVTSEDGVLIVRPSTEDDYGYIDNAVADSGVPSEPVTGGFFCNANSLGIPIVLINTAMGTQVWSVYRHEMQHARQYPVNRAHPYRELVGVSMVNDDGELNQFTADFFAEHSAVQHFLINAHDEALAYFAQGETASETTWRLTHSKLYDFIDHDHDDLLATYRRAFGDTHIDALFGSDERFEEWAEAQIKTIRAHYTQAITTDVHALHAAHASLVEKGHHPEAARALLIKHLSTVQNTDWPSAIERLLKTLDGRPPQRKIPQGTGLDRDRLNLRRRIEREFLSSDAPHDAIHPVIEAERHKITAAIAMASATTDAATLQDLRRQWDTDSTLLEQIAEVIHHLLNEWFALREVQVQPDATPDKTLPKLFILRNMIHHATSGSGLDKLRDILDRKLLLHAAHTQHTLQTHARRFASAPIHHAAGPLAPGVASLPRLLPADVAAMAPKDRFRQVVRLRTTIVSATDAALLQRAVHLYAALVRNGDLGDYRLQREFDSMAGIVLHHPDRMPDLKLAFAAIRGAAGDALWHSFLEQASPTLPGIADRDPKFPGMFIPIAIQ